MRNQDINELICVGDTVIDPMDGEPRVVQGFQDHGDGAPATVYLEDGGEMSLAEINFDDIRV